MYFQNKSLHLAAKETGIAYPQAKALHNSALATFKAQLA
jgi:hypothetical protein